MSSNGTSNNDMKHSEPIAINTSRTGRGRSMSLSSSSSSSSSASDLPTPASPSGSQRIIIPSPDSSPILSYFLAQSPKTAGAGTFPFKRKFGPPPVFEEEEVPATMHARRASTVVAGRFAQPQATHFPEPNLERASGLLRRLSLSNGAFVKPDAQHTLPIPPPSPPPNTSTSPTTKDLPFFRRDTKPRRSATISNDLARPRRAPSPMGERILKGHFDGFN